MKKTLLTLLALTSLATTAPAINANTVEIVFNGQSATITVAQNISSYVTVSSATSSHVVLVQDSLFAGIDKTVDNEDGEIIYVLSGTSTDGSFTLDGKYKCTLELNGLTLTNPAGPAINIQNGKRTSVSAQKGTTNTLTDGSNKKGNGCYHCEGHTKFKGKGTLTINANSKHGVYCEEYVEVKNLTLNINNAHKDGIHCGQYFFMESGTLTITDPQDDGIQVELDNDPYTGETVDHEDENSGNFYMEKGTLTISGQKGFAIKADGSISYTGGKQMFDTSNTQAYTGIEAPRCQDNAPADGCYDLQGRRLTAGERPEGLRKGTIYIVRKDGRVVKMTAR